MARPDIPLPEISAESPEEFERSWTRFTYVAAAKEWDAEKQLKVIPTLIRGQLFDDYSSLSAEERADLATLKKNLASRAGLLMDPLTATKRFQTRKQKPGERINTYLNDLKRLFKAAFPTEPETSSTLLNKFLSDLRPDITQQIRLVGNPETLEDAVAQARNIEQIFRSVEQEVKPVYQVEEEDTSQVKQLCEAVAAVTAQVQKLQQDMKQSRYDRNLHKYQRGWDNFQQPRRGRPQFDSREQDRRCWHCGKRGHFRRDCPLWKPLESNGQKLQDYTLPHSPGRQSICTCTVNSNTSFQVTVLINSVPVRCLIDSGATISLIKHDLLCTNKWLKSVYQSCVLARGANGLPLETKGRTELPIKLGDLNVGHTFVVANNLSIDCILGADFLCKHGAVLDCSEKSLQLRTPSGCCSIPLDKPESSVVYDKVFTVVVAQDVQIEGRHIKCITASLQGNGQHWDYPVQEGLLEPLEGKSIPNHVMCARAVCSIDDDGFLPVQILNGSQQTVTLYKGTRVATLLPLHSVYVVEDIYAVPTTGLPNTEVSEDRRRHRGGVI